MAGAELVRRDATGEERDFSVELSSLGFLRWSEKRHKLWNFADTLVLPQPILITDGEFESWGPNTCHAPEKYPLLFALCSRLHHKLKAQYALISPTRNIYFGNAFEIDADYNGWFEILSENGKPKFRIEHVSDLPKYMGKSFAVMKEGTHAHEYDGYWKTMYLDIGDQFVVKTVHSKDVEVRSCGCGRLLACGTLRGTIFLPMAETGSFSLVTDGQDCASGPHKVPSLCSQKFPLYVKLLEGSPRPNVSEPFMPTMILHGIEKEEVVSAWPMQKDVPIIHIPSDCLMKVKVLENLEALQELPVYEDIIRHILSILPEGKLRLNYRNHPFQQISTHLESVLIYHPLRHIIPKPTSNLDLTLCATNNQGIEHSRSNQRRQ